MIVLSEKKDAALALVTLLNSGLREGSPHLGHEATAIRKSQDCRFFELQMICYDPRGFPVLREFPPYEMSEFQSPFNLRDELTLFEKYVREGMRVWDMQRMQAA